MPLRKHLECRGGRHCKSLKIQKSRPLVTGSWFIPDPDLKHGAPLRNSRGTKRTLQVAV